MDLISLAQGLIKSFGVETVLIVLVADYIFFRRKTENRLHSGDLRFDGIEENIRITGRAALRLEMTNKDLPIEERIRAFKQYVEHFEGNGYMEIYYETVLKPLAREEQTGQEH